jgi:deoxyribonucleoside regulator
MNDQRSNPDRNSLLVRVAEMYYLEEKTQSEIADVVGVTRSMVSRMLTEARARGIVEVRIYRPMMYDQALADELKSCFQLQNASVLNAGALDREQLGKELGIGGAVLLKEYLAENSVLGLAWGSTISAVVDEISVSQPLRIKIVQLVGAMGATMNEYNGQGLVQRLVHKLGGEGYFLNAPFICPTPEIARSLRSTPGIREAVEVGERSDAALLGVGSTLPDYSSFYLAGYVPLEELSDLRNLGAVGDVCGLHFDVYGQEVCGSFCDRLVTIQKPALLKIPLRIGVAGGPGKVDAILCALRGGYINILVTDSITARRLLDLEQAG